MNRVIIISHEPLIVQTERNFMTPQLIERGYELEYWDLSQYVDGGVAMDGELKRDYVRKIGCNEELASALATTPVDDTIFIIELRECWENRKVFYTLAQYGCYMISINNYANVIPMDFRDKLRLFVHQPLRTVMLRLGNWAYGCYKRRLGYVTIRDHFSSSNGDRGVTKRINHPDYERYLAMADRVVESTTAEYIVFIDNYFPEHPDIQYRLKCHNLDGDKYRKSLIRYFEVLEQRYGVPVKIAAHPKAQYNADSFGGREIVKHRSEEMIVGAMAVIMHTSNAVSFALLANKPIQIITNTEYDKCQYLLFMMERIANRLGCEVYNIDSAQSGDEGLLQQVDAAVRREYIYNYLTDPSIEGQYNLDIIIDYIKSVKR